MADEQLKYGWLRGGQQGDVYPSGASEVFKAQSGRFVSADASNRIEVAIAGDTELLGHAETHDHTTSATEGAESIFVINDLTAVFRIPVNGGTWAATMRGKTCDISVASSIQGADLAASGEDVIVLLNGDLVNNNYVDCQLNPLKMYVVGVV